MSNIYYSRLKTVYVLWIIPISATFGLSGLVVACGMLIDFLFIVSRKSVKLNRSGLVVFSWFTLLIIWFGFIMILKGGSPNRLIQAVSTIMTLYTVSTCRIDENYYRFLHRMVQLLLVSWILWWPISGFTMNYYSAFYGHGNFLGSMIFECVAILWIIQNSLYTRKKIIWLEIAAMLFILYMANSRSAIVALAVTVLGTVFLITRKAQIPRTRIKIYFLGCIVACATITIVYPSLVGTPLGTTLELLSRSYFRKNLFSGRTIIWNNIIAMVVENPIFGYGLDAVPGVYYETSFSCHNLYLQIILQTGFVGLGLLAGLLFGIIKTIQNQNIQWKLFIPLCGGLLIHECFEVSLTQNNLASGMICWFILGLALSKSNTNEVNQN